MIYPLRYGNFTILYPWVLFFLLALPALFLLKKRTGSAVPAVRFSSTETMLALNRGGKSSQAKDLLNAITFLTLTLLLLAASRPQLEMSSTRIQTSGVDILLAFDVSGSMRAEDITIGDKRMSRIGAVKRVAQQFIAKRLSDYIGIIAFAGYPYLVSPPTLDHGWLVTNIDRLQAGMMEEDSTAIGSAIAAAARRLRDHSAKSKKVLILLTDGANNAGRISPLTAAEAARVLGIKIYTIGAGSSGPVPYPMSDVFGGTQYRMVEFDSDPATLKKIAEITGGQFFRAADGQSLMKIFQKVNRMERSRVVTTKTSFHLDLFPWPVGIALGLLLIKVLLSQTVWRQLP